VFYFNIYDDEKFVLDFLKEKKYFLFTMVDFTGSILIISELYNLPKIKELTYAMNALKDFLVWI